MKPTPVLQISIQRMVCTGCGAEANASCNCGKPYEPKSVRAREAIEASPQKSNRAIAAETGISEPTVRRARASSDAPAKVTGRDGKEYPTTKVVITRNDEDMKTKINSLISEPIQFIQRFASSLDDWFETCPRASTEALINLVRSLHLCAEEYERIATLVTERLEAEYDTGVQD
jgi:hypothetical protein